MADWSQPKQLRDLKQFYEQARSDPVSVSDDEMLAAVERTFWPTNCWCFAEAAFAIIAPACALRPHLTRTLIAHPIRAMVAGGLEDENSVVAEGIACATKAKPYVEPTSEGKAWLLDEWPALEPIAIQVFREVRRESEA